MIKEEGPPGPSSLFCSPIRDSADNLYHSFPFSWSEHIILKPLLKQKCLGGSLSRLSIIASLPPIILYYSQPPNQRQEKISQISRFYSASSFSGSLIPARICCKLSLYHAAFTASSTTSALTSNPIWDSFSNAIFHFSSP